MNQTETSHLQAAAHAAAAAAEATSQLHETLYRASLNHVSTRKLAEATGLAARTVARIIERRRNEGPATPAEPPGPPGLTDAARVLELAEQHGVSISELEQLVQALPRTRR